MSRMHVDVYSIMSLKKANKKKCPTPAVADLSYNIVRIMSGQNFEKLLSMLHSFKTITSEIKV